MTDAAGNVATETRSVTVGAAPTNTAPRIIGSGSVSHRENDAAAVVTYAAEDDESDTIAWAITGTDAGQLTIDATSGALTFTTPPDFETKSTYSVTVTATDSGTPPLSDTLDVTITIDNVDELGSIAAIEGIPRIEETLTAGMVTDPDRGVSIVGWRWQYAEPGEEYADIEFSTGVGETYVLDRFIGNVGKTVRVVVTYTDAFDDKEKTVISAPTAAIADIPAFLDVRSSHTGGIFVHGDSTYLNAGDTIIMRMEVNGELAASSLVDAVQFSFSGSPPPPAQNLVASDPACSSPRHCVYRAIYTVRDGDTGIPTFRITGVTNTAGVALENVVDPIPWMIDTTAPEATFELRIPEGGYVIGTTYEVALSFPEVVTGLNNINIAAFSSSSGATVINVGNDSQGVAGMDYIIAYEAAATTFSLVLAADSVMDIAGNTGPATAQSTSGAAIVPDTTAPTVTTFEDITDVLVTGASHTHTITFSEAVTGLADTDFSTSSGATVHSVTPDPGPATTYTIAFTPSATTFTLILAKNSVVDAARNPNPGPATAQSASGAAIWPDTTAPTVTTFEDITDVLVTGASHTHTITFSEAVTGLADTDFSTSSGATVHSVTPDPGPATTYTIAFTPSATTFTLTLAVNSVMDIAGNTGPATAQSTSGAAIWPDTTAPTVTTFEDITDVLVTGASHTHTITFSEAVTGLADTDFSTSSGATVHSVTPDPGPATTYTIAFTPSATTFTLILNANSVTDAADNDGPTNPVSVSGSAAVGISSLDGESGVSIKDAKFLYYAHALELALKDSTALATVLGPLTSAGEGELGGLLTAAREELLVDLNGDGDIDAEDAAVLYYSFALEGALGNGDPKPGLPDIKRAILGPLAGTNDMDAINAMLQLVYEQRGP